MVWGARGRGSRLVGLPDRNLFLGNYPTGVARDDQKYINANTTTFEEYCLSSRVTTGIAVMHSIKWTPKKNCVYTVVEAMKEMGFHGADQIKISPFLPTL